jgi:hypothetical protein
MLTAMARLRHTHNGGRAFGSEDANHHVVLSMSLPVAHCLLVLHGRWNSWAFPFAGGHSGRHLGLNLPLVQPLCRNLHVGLVGDTIAGPEAILDPNILQNISDEMRLLFAQVPDPPIALRDSVSFYVSWLQRLRDSMLISCSRNGQWVRDMEALIHTMLLSGMLLSSAKVEVAMNHALQGLVPDPLVRAHYVHLLKEGHTLPSRTTLYRHRLTIAAGYSKLMQELTARLQSGGIRLVRWAMIDSSPQGNHDWLLHTYKCVQESGTVLSQYISEGCGSPRGEVDWTGLNVV